MEKDTEANNMCQLGDNWWKIKKKKSKTYTEEEEKEEGEDKGEEEEGEGEAVINKQTDKWTNKQIWYHYVW